MNKNDLEGVIPAVITPFGKRGSHWLHSRVGL